MLGYGVKATEANSRSTSPTEGTYAEWRAAAAGLLAPLMQMMQPGKADLPIRGLASSSGVNADRLEAFSRPLLLAAHWLAAEPGIKTNSPLSREFIAGWFREALRRGSDPDDPEYWGPSMNAHQNAVEVAAIVLSLEIARPWLWDPFTRAQQEKIARWMGSIRGLRFHRNNHFFFGVLTLNFLQKEGFGRGSDQPCINSWLDILEKMALGSGWFIDGSNETVDYYNPYAFHYYSLWWRLLYGGNDVLRLQRWRAWTEEFLLDYAHFFSDDGEQVPFGRSLIYRFAASAPFALAEKCGISPLAPGMARRICTRNLRFFLSRPILREQGTLNLGWVNEFSELAEGYSCAASPYWMAKGMGPLLLPPDSRFWREPEQPMPAEKDFERAIPAAGFVIRSTGGEVELFNGGTNICASNSAFGPWKWGKLSYRTGVGFELAGRDGQYPADAAFTAVTQDGVAHGRFTTYSLETSSRHLACIYGLGDSRSRHNTMVETYLWWRGNWLLQLHQFDARQPTRFRLGSHSLAAEEHCVLSVNEGFPFCHASNQHQHVTMQALFGFARGTSIRHGRDHGPRTHLYGPQSVCLILETDWMEGRGFVAALTWTGREEPKHLWQVNATIRTLWVLSNPGEEDEWTIEHKTLPDLSHA